MDTITFIDMAWKEVKPSTLDASWKKILPEIVPSSQPAEQMNRVEYHEPIQTIVQLAQKVEGEG